MDRITPVLWPTTPAESPPIISSHVVHFHLFSDPSDILMFTYYLECIYVNIRIQYSIMYYTILYYTILYYATVFSICIHIFCLFELSLK